MTTRSRLASAVRQLPGTLAAAITRAFHGSGAPAAGEQSGDARSACWSDRLLEDRDRVLVHDEARATAFSNPAAGGPTSEVAKATGYLPAQPAPMPRPVRRLGRALTLSGAAACAWLALASAPAFAASIHVFSFSFGSAGSGDGQLSSPQGVAVDQSNGDVYVADTGNARVEKFDSQGNFQLAFGADVGGVGVDTCTSGCVAGTPGSGAGAFTTPTFIAVDSSTGEVYVADTATNLVQKFDSSGNLIASWGDGGSGTCGSANGQLSGACATGGPFSGIAGIAVDTSGNLFVYEPNTQNWFEFAQDGTPQPTITVGRGTLNVGIGLDPAGSFYKVVGDGNVEKYSSSGSDIGAIDPDPGSNTTGFAIDASTGAMYIDDSGNVIRHYAFDSSGNVIEPDGSTCTPAPYSGCAPTDTFGSSNLTGGTGVGVDSASTAV